MTRSETTELQRLLSAAGYPLVADGVAGPKTRAAVLAWAAARWPALGIPRCDDGLLYDVLRALRAAQAPLPARTFGTTGHYRAHSPLVRPSPPTAIVIHDTVSHTAEGAMRTLDAHGYETHFLVDLDGMKFQCMDPDTRYGQHCGGFNVQSIGIDVIAILDPTYANARERKRMVAREWSSSATKGMVIDYTEEQKVALVQLVEELCAAFAIPRVVPAQLTGYGGKVPGLSPAFRGVLAHGQFSSRRWDGLLAAALLLQAGFEPWGAP